MNNSNFQLKTGSDSPLVMTAEITKKRRKSNKKVTKDVLDLQKEGEIAAHGKPCRLNPLFSGLFSQGNDQKTQQPYRHSARIAMMLKWAIMRWAMM